MIFFLTVNNGKGTYIGDDEYTRILEKDCFLIAVFVKEWKKNILSKFSSM